MKRSLLVLALLTLLTGCKDETATINGYVEGDFVRVAPTSGGILAQLDVERGQQVKAGQALFSLDVTNPLADYNAAQAAAAQAKAQYIDITKGRRPEEIDALVQQKAQAQAVLFNAEKEWNRVQTLARKNAVSQQQKDADQAAYQIAKANVLQIDANLKLAGQGARPDEIEAARQAAEQAGQKVIQAKRILSDAAPFAERNEYVEDTFYRPGEYVAAGQPVVSLLPPGNVKARFFLPQKDIPSLRMGQPVTVSCDGCRGAIPAKISFIAQQAEYTPPVIYSVESRDKLVFMVEAKPDTPDPQLRVGLPVDIRLGKP